MGESLAILLCTYNGSKFLQEQLDSFSAQSFKNWSLFIYDDGSTDNTKDLVENYKRQSKNKVNFISNIKRIGFAKNFLNAVKNTPGNFDYYSFADQDDIWLQSKAERAVNYLKEINNTIPALYCSRTTLIDGLGNKIGHSPLFSRETSFSNSLVQSIAGGNTMVFNKAARNLIANLTLKEDSCIVSHDWFMYQLVTGVGGVVHYDPHPETLYRQHGNNLVGSNNGLKARFSRFSMLLDGTFKKWNDNNIIVLKENFELLTPENKNKLNDFIKARKCWLIPRIVGFMKCKIYRQAFLDNIVLFFGGLINKI